MRPVVLPDVEQSGGHALAAGDALALLDWKRRVFELYLLDTVKGADLGSDGRRLVLDLNFAYNPSCSYDPRWACPLAPAANVLPVPVAAGERLSA